MTQSPPTALSTEATVIAPVAAPADLVAALGDAVPHPDPFAAEIHVACGSASRAVDHVSNVEFVRWMDRVAELHCDAAGYPRQRMLDAGVMWFVARHEVDYRAEAVPGDRLLALTWVRDVRRVKSWRDMLFVRPADGTIVCRAATLWVFVNLATRRPMTAPMEMIRAFRPLVAESLRRFSSPHAPRPAHRFPAPAPRARHVQSAHAGAAR